MKGKLCFIKRKSKNLVSNSRIFREKNASFFEHRERMNENLWTFLRNFSSFLFFLPFFWGNDTRSFPTPAIRRFFLRSFVRADGHAPAHRSKCRMNQKKLPTNRGDSSGVWGECGRVPCGVGNLVLTIGTLARVVVENDFAHAHGFGRYFHIFVFANVFQRFFE